MSLTQKEMYAATEQLDIDEIANILYYQHIQIGNSQEHARVIYDTTISEVLPMKLVINNLVENEMTLAKMRDAQ